ncbi:MAG TPA: amidohydrolase family protein [Candidatus Acidoferrales bacterium]|jgi:imidazolonepropionase-like amidohydrolase|nr:amidohydrolase family protein [Candidatus Acidoferrales bacterium]
MRVRLSLFFVSLSFLFCLPGASPQLLAQYPQPGPARVYAIKAGKLVDPEKGTTETNQIILVRGKTIEAVGPNVQIPSDAKLIDLSKSTVLPGLFDAHTHLCMTLKKDRDGDNYYITTLLDPTPYRAIEGVANARDMLASGFTTVRDVGNAGNYADSALREAIERGVVPGPTMINAGRIIAPYGGQFKLQPEKRDLGTPEYAFADTHDEMIKAIRENIHYGAKVIKIVVDDQKYIYSADDIRFMVDEAHRDGLKLAAHCWTRAGAHNAAEAGVDSIEHGERMTNEDLQLAKKNHVVLVGTDFTEIATRNLGMPDMHPVFVDRLKRAYQIGVTMAFGTDAFVYVPGETRGTQAVEYVNSWVEAGVPAKDTLRAMTINAARLLGVDAERGEIKPGMAADIIATPENPLDDIQAVRKVSFVMKDGSVFKSE